MKTAENAGFDHLLAFEHVLGADSSSREDWDGYYDHRTPFLEPMVLVAFLAAETKLELVTDVLVLPQRQTALFAKQAATLDLLVTGGLRLGVGIGWNEVEYECLGMDFKTRAARMEEQIGLIRALWSVPALNHMGRFDRIDRAGIAPRPMKGRIPVWIGCGDSPKALDRVGTLADGWIPHPALGTGARIEKAWNQILRVASDHGRDPALIGLQGQVHVRGGLPTATLDHLERWIEIGASHVGINTLEAGLTWPHDHLRAVDEVGRLWSSRLDR